MEFALEKCELLYFIRAREPLLKTVKLGDTIVTFTTSARFLEVYFDCKLRWGKHLKRLYTKIEV